MNKSFILLWIAVVVLILFFWIYFPTLSRYRDLNFQQEDMEQQVKKLDAKISQLSDERELLKNDRGYLEKVIRDELGLVKPGEVVYKFVKDDSPLPPTAAKGNEKEKAPADSKKTAAAKIEPEKKPSTAVTLKALPVPPPAIPVKSNPSAPEAEVTSPIGEPATPVVAAESSVNAISSEPVYPRQETR